MSKKIVALSTMLLAILLILISVGRVTMRGIVSCDVTFYQTFFLSEKSYYNLIDSGKSLFVLCTFIFLLGCLFLYFPNFLLFNDQRRRSVILAILNTFGIIIIVLFYQSYQYMFMMMVICILFTNSIIIQFIKRIDIINLFVMVFTILILVLNCYYLFEHFIKFQLWINWDTSDRLLKEMIHISRINMACLALWFIPYGILLAREIISNKQNLSIRTNIHG